MCLWFNKSILAFIDYVFEVYKIRFQWFFDMVFKADS